MKRIVYRELAGSRGFWGLAVALGGLALVGLASAWTMEHYGHVVTGMNNQIVWGVPHVVAVFLIVAASGALNVASIASVFKRAPYRPLSRLSGLLAIALMAGGLAVLVLDLGRPERIIVAMTTYNFKSIFAWNIYLYVGFFGIVAAYLFVQMDRRARKYASSVGLLAFVWRLVLTTGTGSIFGFLVAREAYDAAVMAPLFIAMSFAFGLAIFILVMMGACAGGGRDLGGKLVARLGRLLGIFAAAVLYFTAAQHLTNLYAAEHIGIERFILVDGGVITGLFWIGQVVIGGVVPMALVFHPRTGSAPRAVALAAVLVILGGLAQMYVIIIGGQAYPMTLFPGMEVTSSFFDGAAVSYTPSLLEIGLGLGGFAIAGAIVMLGLKVLPFLPESLSDAAVDPHRAEPAPAPAEA